MESADPLGAGDVLGVVQATTRYKHAPEAFLAQYGLDQEGFVQACTVFLSSEAREPAAKVHLLLALQEHAATLLNEPRRLTRFYSALQILLSSGGPQAPPVLLQAQILFTLTDVLCQVDAALTEHARLLSSLVNKLFEIVRTTSAPHLRMLRSAACECLTELDLTYPGLLRGHLGTLLRLTQDEMSHVSQSFACTLATALLNYLLYSNATTGSASPLAVPPPASPFFTLPNDISRRSGPLPTGVVPLSDQVAKDVQRCISVLLDHTPLMTPTMLLDVASKLFASVSAAGQSPEVFKAYLFRYSMACNATLLHLPIAFARHFPKAVSLQERATLHARMAAFSATLRLPNEIRALSLHWAVEMHCAEPPPLRDDGEPLPLLGFSPALQPWRDYFVPALNDHLVLREAKLRALVHSYAATGAPAPPQSLLDVLRVYDDFRSFPPGDPITASLFSNLLLFLKAFPSLFSRVEQFVLEVVQSAPRLVGEVIRFLDQVARQLPTSGYAVAMMRTIADELVEMDMEDFYAQAAHLLRLIQRILCERDIAPSPLLAYLLECLWFTQWCDDGEWSLGHALLGVTRVVAFHHPTARAFVPLTALLAHLADAFADVDIRDQARFQYLVLSHVSREKLERILLPSGDADAGEVDGDSSDVFVPVVHAPMQAIVELSAPLLYLCRALNEPPMCPNAPRLACASLREYFDALEAAVAAAPLTVELRVDVRCDLRNAAAAAAAAAADRLPAKLFAVAIDFAAPQSFGSVLQLQLPYIEASSDDTSTVAFPTCYRVPLQAVPVASTPAWLKVASCFTDADGATFTAPLDPFKLQLEDLFLPPLVDEDKREHLFARLWALLGLLARADADAAAPLSSDADEADVREMAAAARLEGHESVKYLSGGEAALADAFERHLGRFVVGENALRSRGQTSLLIFLPPSSHLLLRVAMKEAAAVVSIRTDNWRLLMYLDAFLDSMARER